MSWTKPTDITGAWIGDDAPDDTTKLQIWIDKAEREIRRKVPDILDRIAAENAETESRDDLLKDAIDVTVEMVTRVFLNPKRHRTVSENVGTGPMSEAMSVTMGGENPGKLYLADDELAKLQAVEERGGAFEINLIPSTAGADRWPW